MGTQAQCNLACKGLDTHTYYEVVGNKEKESEEEEMTQAGKV